jgi:hypothetical protein
MEGTHACVPAEQAGAQIVHRAEMPREVVALTTAAARWSLRGSWMQPCRNGEMRAHPPLAAQRYHRNGVKRRTNAESVKNG